MEISVKKLQFVILFFTPKAATTKILKSNLIIERNLSFI